MNHESIIKSRLLDYALERSINIDRSLSNGQILWQIASSVGGDVSNTLLIAIMIGETCGYFSNGTCKKLFRKELK